jgi:agmatine deiminase
MKLSLLFTICNLGTLTFFGLAGQDSPLPRYLTEYEKLQPILPLSKEFFPNAISNPPSASLRAPGEWEEMETLVISWTGYQSVLAEIVRNARKECEVLICVTSASQRTSAMNFLIGRGVDISSNVRFLIKRFDSIWIRDYGPNGVYINDVDSLILVDWVYNRPRPNDDLLSFTIADTLKTPIYATDISPNRLIHTGGNFMSDGNGLGFSSDLVLEENDASTTNLTRTEIDTIMNRYHGLSQYAIMPKLPFDIIHHIDMHMKILDEETILMGEYPEGISDGPQIEANLQWLVNNFKTKYGKPFRIIRIPMPPDGSLFPNEGGDYKTYANAIFVNKSVLVPIYQSPFDSIALGIWKNALPEYNIVGINCNTIIPAAGALHCITKEIANSNPLWINFPRINDIVNNNSSSEYSLKAQIKHKSEIENADLMYRLSTDTIWKKISMIQDSVNLDYWSGAIPNQVSNSKVHYFIRASAKSGKEISKPMIGYYQFNIQGTTSVNELEANYQVYVFPNPASSITCIQVETQYDIKETKISLLNILGKEMKAVFQGKMPLGKNQFFFNAEEFESGVYFIKIESSSDSKVMKLVIRK